ncbi:MAG: peptidoglycan DD-metalloendopeptidase family protein [Bacteroidales bacterium]|jgi:murein DD-endopeptidase MepM/ murein hydrolase activator NlpD|nr:peptidoglycan DD-metalloendopeptidase family protein [Bacteroidales bacterium]
MKTMKELTFLLMLFVAVSCGRTTGNAVINNGGEEKDVKEIYGLPEQDYYIRHKSVSGGDSFGKIILNLGLSQNKLSAIESASDTVFDVRKIIRGNSYDLLYRKHFSDTVLHSGDSTCSYVCDSIPSYLAYEKDNSSFVLFSLSDSVYVKNLRRRLDSTLSSASFTIRSSLWQDASDAGVSPSLAMEVSDIFSWTVDFFRLQPGDNMKILYDKLSYRDMPSGYGNIYYIEFTHDDSLYRAVRYIEKDSGNKFWDENGKSLRKAFLKAPLHFSRISSRFSYHRLHPIYKVYRAHTGVDYAAPKGTPVRSIGDGTVVFKGWGGGGGNYIKIRHNSIYSSGYMHLSRYARGMRRGMHVKQGDIIGYVGMTGSATGPHLDFRVWKNGTPVDPLNMKSPPSRPLCDTLKDDFDHMYRIYSRQLDSLAGKSNNIRIADSDK